MFISRFNRLWELIMEDVDQMKLPEEYTYRDMTVALVPGCFKPPHKGHWEMIMSYLPKADKVIVLASNISRTTISARPLSKVNRKELDSLKNQIEWMKANWAPSPRIDEDYEIIHSLLELEALSYSELKAGLEKIQKAGMLRSPTYRKI